MRRRLFLGIDIGTSAVKCLLADEHGAVKARAAHGYATRCGNSLEQDPQDWWIAVCHAVNDCLRAADGQQPEAISFSGHMSAPVLLDACGAVLRPAILIADTRSEPQAKWMASAFGERIKTLCGNPAINAFLAPKLRWCVEQEPEVWRKAESLLLPKDYIRYRLCGRLGTDRTDAGNSLFFDPVRDCWDTSLASAIGISPRILPEVLSSDYVCGGVSAEASAATGLREGIPVIVGAADMACSQIGSGADAPGVTALTLSTSIQIIQAAEKPIDSLFGKMTWHPSVSHSRYVMASVFAGGLSLEWALRLIGGGKTPREEEYAAWDAELNRYLDEGLASSLPIFLPFLTGSGSPRFDASEKAGFWGLNMETTPASLLLAVLEGVAFHTRENIELLDAYFPRKRLFLAGGGCRMKAWARILAGVLGQELCLLSNHDVSALGAVMLAARGAGITIKAEEANPICEIIRCEKTAYFDGRYHTYLDRCIASASPRKQNCTK